MSGCLAERTNLIVYPILTVVMSMWIHPVCAFWAWNATSWLQSVSHCQFLDFAGGTVVHIVGEQRPARPPACMPIHPDTSLHACILHASNLHASLHASNLRGRVPWLL